MLFWNATFPKLQLHADFSLSDHQDPTKPRTPPSAWRTNCFFLTNMTVTYTSFCRSYPRGGSQRHWSMNKQREWMKRTWKMCIKWKASEPQWSECIIRWECDIKDYVMWGSKSASQQSSRSRSFQWWVGSQPAGGGEKNGHQRENKWNILRRLSIEN